MNTTFVSFIENNKQHKIDKSKISCISEASKSSVHVVIDGIQHVFGLSFEDFCEMIDPTAKPFVYVPSEEDQGLC